MYDASVVIPTYNRSHLLELTLSSLLKQDLRDFTFETIVVDDGSKDDTKCIVDKYSYLLNIKYLYHEHKGYAPSKTRNAGINASDGTIVIFIDSGIIAGKNLIYEHCASNRRHGECAVIGSVYGLHTPLEDEGFNQLFDINDIEKSLLHFRYNRSYIDIRYYSYPYFNFNLSKDPAPWYYFWTCNVSVPRNVLKGSVMFDESFGSWGVEDVDLGLRIYKTGLPFVLDTYAEVIHIPHSTREEFEEKNKSSNENIIHFHKVHNCIESEICCCAIDINMNMYIKILLDAERFDFTNISVNGLFNFLDNKSVLVYGGYNGSILKYLPDATLLEYSKDSYEQLRSMLTTDKVYHYLGAFTPLQEKFDAVLITDFWDDINEQWLFHILKESQRLSKTIYLIFEIIVGNKRAMFVEDEKMEGFIRCVTKLNKEFHIKEQTVDNIILKVLCI